MRVRDCFVLSDVGGDEPHQYLNEVLDGTASCERVTLDILESMEIEPRSELGILFVPALPEMDLDRVREVVQRLRKSGVYLGVLGLVCPRCDGRKLDIKGLFDGTVDLSWPTTPTSIRNFVYGYRIFAQNRGFKSFLDSTSDGYWIWNVEADHIEWSDRMLEMTGLDAKEAPQTVSQFTNLIHPQDRERVGQAIQNHLSHKVPYKDVEMRIRKGNGELGHFLANGRVVRNHAGQPTLFVGSMTDRTLMQRVEQQLENTQKRFTVLFHHMNDAAALADVETGLILEANQPAELLWGRSISDLVGSHQSSLHPPIISEEAKQAFENHIAALKKNKRDSIQLPILRSDGTEIPAEISSSLIEIDGKMTILGVFRDISERIKAEQELRERDAHLQLSSHLESIGTLAAGVAHEINNPLTYVLGNLETIRELLQDRGVVDPEIISAIDTATTGGGYVREIVSDLKAMSRMDAKDETCDPAAVVRVASRMAMSDLRHRAKLEMNLADTAQVKVASARLSQVVLNVLSNASRAFSGSDLNKNRISIDLFEHEDAVRIEVQDNGAGIAPEDLKHVWEPFFTRSERQGGTGLGLAICRRILTEVGGTLELESELGQGTKVTITIPMAQMADGLNAEEAKSDQVVLNGRPKVLVVDDDALVTTIIDRMLRNDFDLTIYNSAIEALEHLRAGEAFDIILCDIMMPEMDGRAFHEAAATDVPFIFLTGGAVTQENIEFERRMAQQGRLIYKPFEAENFAIF